MTKPILEGAYRRHQAEDIGYFTQLAREAFPQYARRIQCFGADWLGRQFATDTSRIIGGSPQVLMLEPGTGQTWEIPASIDSFHKTLLTAHPDVVAYQFYRNWLAEGGKMPGYNECIGYRVPLFLGGEDDVANLEPSDFEVYWTISAQLLAKVRDLPDGTVIKDFTISE